jgi:ribosomal protein L11 methyltransferase
MSHAAFARGPYENLYIYYIKGRLPAGAVIRDNSFIGNWEEEQDSFLFFNRASDERIRKVLDQYPHLVLSDQFQMTYDQWQGGALSPLQVGDIYVVPAWQEIDENMTNRSILLDPGVVFGAGTHPTTRDCLAAVQSACDGQSVGDVVDLGTGTGLLAMAAVHCGAQRCAAVDLNRLAVETAFGNARRNNMLDRMVVVQGDAKNFMDLSWDLMISNIHYDIMRYIVAAPGFRVTKQFILSGLLRSQARQIEQRLLQGGAKILQTWERDGIWFTFHGMHAVP